MATPLILQMPRKCCAPGCRSNYSGSSTALVFRFPKDKDRRDQWIRAIPRKDFTPSDNTVLCENHFVPECIIREDTLTRPDGTAITAKRGTPKLSNDAFPSVFPNLPKYLSKEVPTKRTTVEEREKRLLIRDESVLNEGIEKDHTASYSHFCDEYKNRVARDWISVENNDSVSFFQN